MPRYVASLHLDAGIYFKNADSMTQKAIRWDDIPSLDGVGVDWDFNPTTSLGNRAFVRIAIDDIPRIFSVSKILLKVATIEQTYMAQLLDISAGGLAMLMPVPLKVEQPVKVGFYLGAAKIISKAIVRHAVQINNQYKAGVEFVDLDSESAGYINGLYASLVLKK